MPYKDPNDPRKLEAQRRHYEQHSDKVKEAVAARRKQYREKWLEFKKTLQCTRCGENHPAALDFHHLIRDSSYQSVNTLAKNGQYRKAVEETKKCIVLCANCHRKHHWEEVRARKAAKKAARKSSP